jgi:ATP-dependent DNA helicase RecQ
VSYEKDLYAELKDLRKTIADSSNVPAYIILGDSTLIEIAAYLPLTLDDMRKISGFGDVKIQRYGQEFLELVKDYAIRNRLATRINQKQPKRERKANTPMKAPNKSQRGTSHVTLEMHRQGIPMDEIAEQRRLSPQTIANHLAQFVETGELRVEDFVSSRKIDHLKPLIEKHGYMSLKTIKDNADEDITYNDIRFVVSSIMSGAE